MPRAPADEKDTPVFIAKSYASIENLRRPVVGLIADFDDWNDYGYGFFASMRVLSTETEHDLSVPIRFMFENRDRTAPVIAELLEGRDEPLRIDEVTIRSASSPMSRAAGFLCFSRIL